MAVTPVQNTGMSCLDFCNHLTGWPTFLQYTSIPSILNDRVCVCARSHARAVAQSCPTLCDPMDYTVHGILQARILGWVAFPFSMGSSQPWDRTQASLITGGFFTS